MIIIVKNHRGNSSENEIVHNSDISQNSVTSCPANYLLPLLPLPWQNLAYTTNIISRWLNILYVMLVISLQWYHMVGRVPTIKVFMATSLWNDLWNICIKVNIRAYKHACLSLRTSHTLWCRCIYIYIYLYVCNNIYQSVCISSYEGTHMEEIREQFQDCIHPQVRIVVNFELL